ncbi:MAG TPA: hypothetical protein VGQ83_08030 [Polyangia bacterium]|jgi:hypothetical protein
MTVRSWSHVAASLALALAACGDGRPGGAADAAAGDGGARDGARPSDGPGGGDAPATADGPPGAGPTVGGCPVFPASDHWNRDVSGAAVDTDWTDRLLALVGDVNLHPDLGNSGTEHYGIPYNVVPQSQPPVVVQFVDWPEESDPGPYPFLGPAEIRIEGENPSSCAGDCHVLVVQQGVCKLFEGYACSYSGGWNCSNGAVWDLTRVASGQRPIGWTSADAAGLPILPGLLRYDETMAGAVRHALRFTVSCTRPNYVAPASHFGVPDVCDAADPNSPPMGLRVRLKASFAETGFNPVAQTVLRALKTYGMILADNGGDFFFQGEENLGWDDDVQQLKQVPVSAFEVVGPNVLQP